MVVKGDTLFESNGSSEAAQVLLFKGYSSSATALVLQLQPGNAAERALHGDKGEAGMYREKFLPPGPDGPCLRKGGLQIHTV